MTLEQLRIFVAVAEALHFTRAAEALHLTQPAVSAAIASLEDRYGVRLFDRIGRRIELTRTGALLLAEARAVLQKVGDIETLLSELSGLRRGALALIASQTVGAYWMPPRLHRFAERYPGIEVALTIGNTAEVQAAIREGRAELGVAEGRIDDPDLLLDEVPGDRLVLVVGRSHPWFGRKRIAPRDLAATAWVMREEGSGTRDLFDRAVREFGLDPKDLRVALVLPNGEAVRAAVIAGAGAAVLSDLVVAADLRHGMLHRVGLELPDRRFVLVRHRARYQSEAARAFLRIATGGTERPSRGPRPAHGSAARRSP